MTKAWYTDTRVLGLAAVVTLVADARWVNLMANWIATHNVSEATHWDYGTSTVDSGRNPSTAAALAMDFAEPR